MRRTVVVLVSLGVSCAPQQRSGATPSARAETANATPAPADADRILAEAQINARVPSYDGVALSPDEGVRKARELEKRAGIAQSEGRYADADAPLLEAIAIWKRIGGPEHVDTLNDEMNLAVAWRRRGDAARSVPVLERVALRLAASADPEARELAIRAKNNLAAAYRGAGQLGRARDVWQECLRVHDKALGAKHDEQRARVLDNLSQVTAELGDAATAEALARRGLREWTAIRGDDNVDTAKSAATLASALLAQHKLADAEPLLVGALRTMRATSHGLDVAALLTLMGKLRFDQQDRAAAHAAFAEALELTRGFYPDDHTDVRDLRASLAAVDGAR